MLDRKDATQVIEETLYWLQRQAPAGSWYDTLSSPLLESVTSHKKFLESKGTTCRIVMKTLYVLPI